MTDTLEGLDYEDVLLNGFESTELRRECDGLKRRVVALERQLAEAPSTAKSDVRSLGAEAQRFQSLYEVTVRRNQILANENRALKDELKECRKT